MTREGYLRLKYWSNEPFLRIVRAGFLFFLGGALTLTISNLIAVLWTFYRLIFD